MCKAKKRNQGITGEDTMTQKEKLREEIEEIVDRLLFGSEGQAVMDTTTQIFNAIKQKVPKEAEPSRNMTDDFSWIDGYNACRKEILEMFE